MKRCEARSGRKTSRFLTHWCARSARNQGAGAGGRGANSRSTVATAAAAARRTASRSPRPARRAAPAARRGHRRGIAGVVEAAAPKRRTRASALRCDDRLVTPSLAMTSSKRRGGRRPAPRTWRPTPSTGRCGGRLARSARIQASSSASYGRWSTSRSTRVRYPALKAGLAFAAARAAAERPSQGSWQEPAQRRLVQQIGRSSVPSRSITSGGSPKRRTPCGQRGRAAASSSARTGAPASVARRAPRRRLSEMERSSG